MDFIKLISDVNNWNDLDNKIKSLTNTTEMGDAFELLTKHYFQIDPKLKVKFQEVWLQNEIPQKVRKKLGLPNKDLGFDLLVESDNQYFPVQCKYHSDFKRNITFQEVSTFLTLYESNSKLSKAFITSTAGDVSNNYKKVVNKPVQLILNDTWQSLDKSFFNQLRNKLNNKTYSPEAYYPRKHQEKALIDSKEYFIKNNKSKGKLIFPCGAGKSLTGFWMSQELGSKTTLIAVPSLSLIKQTLDVYLKEFVARDIKVKFLCICSDEGIGKNDDIAFKTENIGVPCDTDPVFIKQWLKDNRKENIVVFTTYQSGRIIAELSKELKLSFEVGIFDEAHKTVGSSKKLFSHLLFDDNISVQKRIYMTATERFYSGSKDDIISMDDEDIYGETFSFMSFKDAINEELLTDYKIITIDVKKSEIAEFIKTNGLIQLSDKWKKETEARSLSSMIALRKAMNRFDIKNVVSFHSSIERAKRNMGIHSYITSTYGYKPIDTFTVSGKDSTSKRSQIVKEFAESDKALITNARCLTEGVDVPNIDCIVFADPRKSKVDIVQALGRALRKKEGKDWGYVILPVVYDEKTNEIDNDNFNEILSIIRGLASNDERIIEYFKDKNQPNSTNRIEGSDIFQIDSELLDEKDLVDSLEIKLWENLSRFEWTPFEEAREYVRSLNIKTSSEWRNYCNSGKKPNDIPKSADIYYKGKGWKSWPDFLGTKIGFDGKYMTFDKAKKFIKKFNLNSQRDFQKFLKTNTVPVDFPSNPSKVYESEWLSLPDFLGYKPGYIHNQFYDFDYLKKIAQDNNITTQNQWRSFAKDDFKIPASPNQVYKKNWLGWSNFLSINEVRNFRASEEDFIKAREFVRKLKLKDFNEYRLKCKDGSIPEWIPRTPYLVYENCGWIDIDDFLGKPTILSYEECKALARSLKMKKSSDWKDYVRDSGRLDLKSKIERYYSKQWKGWEDFLGIQKYNFKEARYFVTKQGFKNKKEFDVYIKSDKRNSKLPQNPKNFYKDNGWLSWPDFLGTHIGWDGKYLSFEEAKKYVRKLNIRTSKEWKEYSKSGKKPKNIPRVLERIYKEDWVSMDDFLGTKIHYVSFEEAKKYVRKLNIRTSTEWNKYSKNGKKPKNIPFNFARSYKNDWKGWDDFLGKPSILSYEECKTLARSLKMKKSSDWKDYVRDSGRLDLKSKIERYYLKQWKGWKDFLGND